MASPLRTALDRSPQRRLSQRLFLSPKFRRRPSVPAPAQLPDLASSSSAYVNLTARIRIHDADPSDFATGTRWVGGSSGEEDALKEDLDEDVDHEDDTGDLALRRVLYAILLKDGVRYHVGDDVLMANAADPDLPFVGQLKKMWADKVTGRMKVRVCWYYRPEDTRHGRRPQHGRHELFFSDAEDTNEVASICGRIRVLDYDAFVREYDDDDDTVSNVYYCRLRYDDRRREFVPGAFSPSKSSKDATAGATQAAAASRGGRGARGRGSRARGRGGRGRGRGRGRGGHHDGDGGSSDGDDHGRGGALPAGKAASAPRAPRGRGRGKTASGSAAGGRRQPQLSVLVPTVTYAAVDGTDAFELAKMRLHVSAVPDSLPCREAEFEQVHASVSSAIREGTGSCIYISGVPGTGKTATVHEVLRRLKAEVEEDDLVPFDFVELNGMRLTDPANAYSVLWEALTTKKLTPAHAAVALEKHFSVPNPRRHSCVVLMDELDLLVTRKQTVIYNFFDWPNRRHSRLVVVAVANTMDLPERMLTHRISSRLGLNRITFEPYTHRQLIEILSARLRGIEAFDPDAIELCARKVAAVSGDARRALDICRRAVDIRAEANADRAADLKSLVGMDDIDAALKEMLAATSVLAVRSAALHEKLLLCALIAAVRASGAAEATFSDVAERHLQLCRLYSLRAPSTSDLTLVCARLAAARIILAEAGHADLGQRLRLNLSEDDVAFALRNDEVVRRMLPARA